MLTLLTRRQIRLCSILGAGLGYLSAVSRLEIGDEAITAAVDGSDAYQVELTGDEDSGLTGWCYYPVPRQEGNFCKHRVAVRLTVLRQADSVPRAAIGRSLADSALDA
ncbi:SWIM zinc finger domain-containing protein [Streptomyces sp. NPDC090021]|uniref:SWIM zinc finger family protein n=1 Tax=Streptomyces sp. NPDC090021 TaxID=3365919 RepID=UPI0037F28626